MKKQVIKRLKDSEAYRCLTYLKYRYHSSNQFRKMAQAYMADTKQQFCKQK